MIGVDHQAIVRGQCFGVERIDLVGVSEVNAALRQNGLQLAKALGGLVVAVVAEEEDLDRRLFGDSAAGKRKTRVQNERVFIVIYLIDGPGISENCLI